MVVIERIIKKAQLLGVAKSQGMSCVMWSVDTHDWKTRNGTVTYNSIITDSKDGSIVLCYDICKTTFEAMKDTIPKLIEDGYQLVTVSELLYYLKVEISPGEVYLNGYKSS